MELYNGTMHLCMTATFAAATLGCCCCVTLLVSGQTGFLHSTPQKLKHHWLVTRACRFAVLLLMVNNDGDAPVLVGWGPVYSDVVMVRSTRTAVHELPVCVVRHSLYRYARRVQSKTACCVVGKTVTPRATQKKWLGNRSGFGGETR